jgi:hypothetical protein
MEATPRSALLRSTPRRIAKLVLVSYLVAAAAGAMSQSANSQASTAARWVPRTIHFMYSAVAPSSETTYYSCDRLQERIKAILSQLGARDATIKPFGCVTNGGPERFPGVDATFSVLEPAVTGDHGESEKVAARWRKVTLNTEGSCALMEQVQRRILPLFATRNPTSSCSLSVEVLQPVEPPAPVS